jgi:hypothetical protein
MADAAYSHGLCHTVPSAPSPPAQAASASPEQLAIAAAPAAPAAASTAACAGQDATCTITMAVLLRQGGAPAARPSPLKKPQGLPLSWAPPMEPYSGPDAAPRTPDSTRPLIGGGTGRPGGAASASGKWRCAWAWAPLAEELAAGAAGAAAKWRRAWSWTPLTKGLAAGATALLVALLLGLLLSGECGC